MKKHLRIDIADPALHPSVGDLLRRLPPEALFHAKYPFRHPAAIYQLSLRQLASDFKRVLTDYQALRNGTKQDGLAEQIGQSQRILVYSLREHLDDCQMILMCLADPGSVASRGKSPDEFLKASGLVEQKLFWHEVCNHADSYLMPLVNALKHSQGRFRTVTFTCSPSDIRPGFYLEEVDANGIAQPSMKLHQGNSAYSYAKDLRRNLGFVFRASEGLSIAVQAVLKRLGKSLLATPEGAEISSGPWAEICKLIASLDGGVFPQELKSSFTRVFFEEGVLKIRELDRDQQLLFPKGDVKCTTQTSGDGMTKTYRMPYAFGNKPRLK